MEYFLLGILSITYFGDLPLYFLNKLAFSEYGY